MIVWCAFTAPKIHWTHTHARSDVVLRSRKVVKSITAHIGDRAIRALRKRLRLRSACSAAPASRASKPDMDGLKSASSFTAGVWRRNEEKWRLLWAAFVVVWLASSSTLATTSSMRATISAASLVAGYFHNHNEEATTSTTHATHATSLLPAPATCSALSGRCNSAW